MAAGRPTKLTPEVQEKMLVAIRGGNYREVASQWAGILAGMSLCLIVERVAP